ncbi:hypothetical protein M3Y97_00825900 [Aphelenchoides bicaudatus]|nr:hypothetical protein M3Y97_00825900 [Aphelenchoides bicaudatus]
MELSSFWRRFNQRPYLLLTLASFFLNQHLISAQSVRKVHLGFPDSWDGDKYQELFCPSKNIPKFIASYGNQDAAPGHKLNHMIDALGAVGAFHISNGQVVFSAKYYPARPFKIWEFYDRNMTKASVPWAGWSDYNLTAMNRWEQIPPNSDSARFHPNLDFWRVRSLSKFKLFPFTEENDVFGNPRPSMIPISMSIHERTERDGTIWATFSAMNFNDQRFYQGIFTVSPEGVRKVLGMYDYGVWDSNACGKNDEYIGDKTLLPGYVHSITSTENYVIIPVTSLLINPCKFKEPPISHGRGALQKGGFMGNGFSLYGSDASMFVTHQLNAYEDTSTPDFLTSQPYPNTARVLRFTLDIENSRVMYSYLIPQETISADFPQINHAFDSRHYKWAYMVEHPFSADNTILKINVEDATGDHNKRFKTDPSLVMHEPWFVARPDASREDDGVLIIRALDVAENKGVLLIVDATTMAEIGRAYVPISIPFGFHNRFFSKRELGIPEGFQAGIYGASETRREKFLKPTTLPPSTSSESNFWARLMSTTRTIIETQTRQPTWIPISPSESTESSYTTRGVVPIDPKQPSVYPSGPPNPSILPPSSRPDQTDRPRLTTTGVTGPYGILPGLIGRPSSNTREAGIRTVTMRPPSMLTTRTVPTASTSRPDNSPSVKQLYDQTLKAFCHWLTRIFKSLHYESCVDSGHRAIRYRTTFIQSRIQYATFRGYLTKA